ncbi:MAG: hypothetical protein NUV49_03155 [Patescibacteria group bacterium]|nr:hypothetical protein [Patescibacteria group bacterium]
MKLLREVLNEHGELIVSMVIIATVFFALYRFFSRLSPGSLGG